MNYSQNNEQEIVMNHFNGRMGRLLDIGANDGITYSNSAGLLVAGWTGVLLEPSPSAFRKLMEFVGELNQCDSKYRIGSRIFALNCGIADSGGYKKFHESGSYKREGKDIALLSCLDEKEKQRWGNDVDFEEIDAHFYTFADFLNFIKDTNINKFDFITIDAEGYDWRILQQIDLNAIGCQCCCIEHNGVPEIITAYREYCGRAGMHEIGFNGENIIMAK
jgi:FkbM family methyltransferase